MTSRNRIGLAASLVLGALALSAGVAPASAAWWGNGQWQPDNRWNNNSNNKTTTGTTATTAITTARRRSSTARPTTTATSRRR